MNNIYDLFNDRKNEIESICESQQVEEVENEFDSIEEGLEYMDELLQESNNDMIEWQAACYMEDLVLEQMMYEDFNANEMEFIIEGSLKERFSDLGEKLNGIWENIKKWFQNMMNKLQDHMSSGEALFQKYGEGNIQQALSKSDLSLKFPELGDPFAAINKMEVALQKVGSIDPTTAKGAYQNAFIDYAGLGAKDEKGLMTAIKKLIFPLENPSITKVNSLNAKVLVKYARYGKVKDLFNKAYKFNEMTFKQAMAAAKGKREAEKTGDVGGQAYYYLLTLRQRMISAFLGAYNQAANACRSVIIKVMNGKGAVKESTLMEEYEEYLDEGFVNRMKMRKMSKEEMDEKIADIEGQIAEIEGKEEQDKKDAKQLKKLRKQLADVQKVKAKKHPEEPAQESSEINWDGYDYLDEGLKDKMAAAKAKVGEKVGAMKEKHGEKKGNHKIAKKEKDIAKIRANIEKRRAEYDKMKGQLEKEKEYLDEFEEEANEDIARLMQEIEALKNQLAEKKAVAQESFFYDESEIEVLEESIKEKIGELNDKVNEKIGNAIMKLKKNPEKLRAQIAKEQEVISKLEAIREERGEEDAKWAKAKNIMLASCIGEAIAKGKKGELATNKWIANALKGCRAFISRAEKRLAELEPEEAAQESYFDFDDMEDVEEGFINRFKMRKMSKEEFEEKIQGLEARIAELEGMEERDKKQEKELKKLRGQVADAKKVMNKKHPEEQPAAESWGLDDIEFLD